MNRTTDSAVAENDDPASPSGEGDPPQQPEPADQDRAARAGDRPVVVFVADGSAARAVAGLDLERLETQLRAAITHLDAPVARVTVRLLADPAMAALHHRHLGLDEATDVLTFPASEPGGPVEVDIAVGAEVAARLAAERGHAVERELLLYALHGVLHVSGYDDHDEADFRRMHEREDAILRAIGVGSVFTREDEA